ncbi:MAG: nucleoside kinase [Muribaculaceae bacterium]|nr:nucleoside kinase [Muribaculaceae bacterium]
MIKIFCLNTRQYIDVEGGLTLMQLAVRLASELPFTPICARVNNKTQNLAFPIYQPKQIEFLSAQSPAGQRVVVRSLCMLLYRAVYAIDPSIRLRIEHSISRGILCHLYDADNRTIEPSDDLIASLHSRMSQLVSENHPFIEREASTEEVIEIFRRQGLDSKVTLLRTSPDIYTTYYTLDGVADSYYSALAPTTGFLRVFDLVRYHDGLLLLGPDASNPDMPQQPITQEKMLSAYREHILFNRTIKVSDVGQLNMAVRNRETSQLIHVAEAMHDKYLGAIAARIAEKHKEGGARIVLLAGPSSSGKTTTTKRLGIQLMTNLLTPKMISLDDYFVDREKTPHDQNGDYDYESLYALDLERLNSDLRRLLAGETINLPTYSFELGARVEKDRPMHLEPDEVLLIEGIHGLNPELTSALPQEQIFKIYVSALTSLSIDDHNWISTTDNRLLRRIVRDHKYRNTSAKETIRRWPSVRRGEERWIFPFQENADATFNSSLIFELGVMKNYAEPLLRQVAHNSPEYSEAYRLLKFLDYFEPIPADQVPTTSLLREFLGGSSFHY